MNDITRQPWSEWLENSLRTIMDIGAERMCTRAMASRIPGPRGGGESIGGDEEWQLANQSAKQSIESITAIVRIVGAKSLTRICR